jgi:hypothetical protein
VRGEEGEGEKVSKNKLGGGGGVIELSIVRSRLPSRIASTWKGKKHRSFDYIPLGSVSIVDSESKKQMKLRRFETFSEN